MEFDRRAAAIIEHAEKELAALAGQAAAERDYLRAAAFLAMAQRVASAGRPDGDGLVAPQATEAALAARAPALTTVAPVTASSRRTPGAARAARAQASAAVPVADGDRPRYPRFKREGDTLVKIGWSKSDRTTYEHRSPRDVLLRLVAKIREAGANGERFTTEQLMPLHDDEGAELPSYQAYLCLAWLVAAGLLEKHGRQGYTLRDADVDRAVETEWAQLPKR